MKMKIRVGNKIFKVGGLVKSDTRPLNCSNWEDDFGTNFGDYPDTVDLRSLMSPVEDQSQIGSCTANAVAGAYEYLCNVAAGQNGDEPGDISRLFIYWSARKYDLQQRDMANQTVQDNGSSISGAINALAGKGACLEDTYPYDINNVNNTPPSEAFDEALDYKISSSWKVRTSVDDFKDVLSKGYPIVIGVKLTESFMQTQGRGIINAPQSGDSLASIHGLHAMLVVGYYESHQVFVVRNSWGEDWGYGGYCFMTYDYVANQEYNLDDNYAINGLTDYDFTPDDNNDGGCGFAVPDDLEEEDEDEEERELPEVEQLSDSDDDEEPEEDGEFDPDEFFSKYADSKRVFDLLDTDGSGVLELTEIERALKMNGRFVTDESISEIMEKYDYDGNGVLRFVEYLQILGVKMPKELLDDDEQTTGSETEDVECEDDECDECEEEEGDEEEEEEEGDEDEEEEEAEEEDADEEEEEED